jgi:hypothetical protein
LRKQWGKESVEFKIVDLICYTLKHVDTGPDPDPQKKIPWKSSVPGAMGFNTHMFNESGPDVRHIYLLARAVASFIRTKADAL